MFWGVQRGTEHWFLPRSDAGLGQVLFHAMTTFQCYQTPKSSQSDTRCWPHAEGQGLPFKEKTE